MTTTRTPADAQAQLDARWLAVLDDPNAKPYALAQAARYLKARGLLPRSPASAAGTEEQQAAHERTRWQQIAAALDAEGITEADLPFKDGKPNPAFRGR